MTCDMPDASEPYLRTRRLGLRRVVVSDLDDFMRLNADEGVMRFISRNPPARQAVRLEIEQILTAYETFPSHGRFVAEDRTGTFLGWFGLQVTGAGPAAPSLGYRLRRAVWGRGLATEGGLALVDHAF